jgi:5-methylthioadenosine/S-adenosylhomocysteine deaminase
MDSANTLYPDGAIALRGGEILAVGPSGSLRGQVRAKRELPLPDRVVLPGLVNAHTHAAMTLFRGLADDVALEPWLARVWKIEPVFATPENVALGTRLAFAEMISGGTTAAADMYFHPDAAAETAREVGFRLAAGVGAIDVLEIPSDKPREVRTQQFLETYRGDRLVHPCVQVHATYSATRATLENARELVEKYHAPFITHAAESRQEIAQVGQATGMTPIEYLDSLGLLTPMSALAHCIWLRDDEIELIARRGASISHCPESNLKIGAGIARIPDLLKAGVNLGLGTDGAASNNDLDMWGEMHTAALIHKGAALDPTAVPALQVLQMATIGGARALHMDHLIGSLEPGKRADLCILSLDGLNLTPVYDLISHLVYAAHASDVESVFIDGQMVMQDRRLLTIDREEVRQKALRVAEQVKAAL